MARWARYEVIAIDEVGFRIAGNLPLLVVPARLQQLCVQMFQIRCLRHRHPVVTTEITDFPFDAAFLMSFSRVAELARKPPVQTERDETFRFFTPAVTPVRPLQRQRFLQSAGPRL
jgi:hypothetical protein